ncbi:hypothetical protein [Kitasatospora sp. NPDC057198]|uniref:hypothetical protein n=1 Tax=Kitasatospora sp. NPDC057198 TaxID=3346046 RepID=UPI00362B93CF
MERLLERRGLDPGGSALGAAPDPEALRELAPALGLHAADLFVLAGLPVPEDLAPLDPGASRWASGIVQAGADLSAAGRRELLDAVRALPQRERTVPFGPGPDEPRSDGPGGRVARLFRQRNLGLSGLAEVLGVVTPSYLAMSTHRRFGDDRLGPAPRLLADYAALAGIDVRDLSALTGLPRPEPPPPVAPLTADSAALLWELRRLSAGQAHEVARSLSVHGA